MQLFIPEASADQLFPFHLAMYPAEIPPAVLKYPPSYKSLPDAASAYTWGLILPLNPEPSADQLLPFHFAVLVAGLPPAVVNEPPTYKLPPDTASASTEA